MHFFMAQRHVDMGRLGLGARRGHHDYYLDSAAIRYWNFAEQVLAHFGPSENHGEQQARAVWIGWWTGEQSARTPPALARLLESR